MNIISRLFAVILLSTLAAQAAEPVGKQFLRYIYGADGIELTNICHPSDDLWMLHGAKNTNALAALEDMKVASKPTGTTSGVVGRDIYFIETRNGKVDAAFNLDSTYVMHRQLILRFIYSALSRDDKMLDQLVTHFKAVKIDGPKAAAGDMDVYDGIIAMLPVVRSSNPTDDAKSQTVTYRIPLGETALPLTLLKENGVWKIDTSKGIRVPLEFFFRER